MSDQHFGAPTAALSKERETLFVHWLERIKHDASHLFLLGDLFDFWFEYKKVVPKGFVRVLGKLAELKDLGVEIHFFIGNHDLWMRDYFETELGIPVYYAPQAFIINDKSFLIGHGDGLGPGDKAYKLMNRVFKNRFSQWLFRWLHPDIGMRLGHYFSVENKMISGEDDVKFLGEDKEMLILYCKDVEQRQHFDYYLFGHRHLPMEIKIGDKAMYINTGDWITYFSFATFDGKDLFLQYLK